jgi:hypothetical protein
MRGECRAHAKTIARNGLAAGYPQVVHSDELGLADRTGVAVVLGLFANEAAAEAWRAGTPSCTRDGGDFAVLTDRAATEHVYEAVPFTCPNGSAVFVAWGDTLLGAMIGPRCTASRHRTRCR